MSAKTPSGGQAGTLLPGSGIAGRKMVPESPAPEQPTPCDMGQACEHFVAFDLLARGLEVTKPLNTNGKHDIHAKCGDKWITIQVKKGRVNPKTKVVKANNAGRNSRYSDRNVTSDVLAAVDARGRRVRYIPFNIPELPKELR